MAEPTLIDVFGAGASQTATTVTIAKADLDITASASNKAEGLLAAVVKKAQTALTATAYDTNPDQNIKIEDGFPSIGYRTENGVSVSYLQTPVSVVFTKSQSNPGITPNDY